MQHNAIAPCNTSNNVEKVEDFGEGKQSALLGADEGLSYAEWLEAVDALLRAAFSTGDVQLA